MIPSPADSQKGSTSKKPPVRRDPEKRRQQNIQAQKKYREKLKRRLDLLNALAAAPDSSDSTTTPTTTVTGTSTATTSSSSSPAVTLATSRSESSDSIYQIPISNCGPAYGHPASVALDGFDLSSDLALWDSTVALTLPSSSNWPQYVDCGCSVPHIEILHDGETIEYRDSRRSPDEQQQCGGDAGIPSLPMLDTHANAMGVQRVCIVNAFMTNCDHIGATNHMMCEDDDAVSPFYRANSESSVDIAKVVRTVQNIFKVLKPDLRPIREQIVIAHHPIIDVLPFPTLRKNLIQANFKKDDIYHDLVNGLICWGRAGAPRKDHASGLDQSCTPWDSRSWEGRPWFLQKYWTTLGGEEGELVRQSEWWRSLRGEQLDPLCIV